MSKAFEMISESLNEIIEDLEKNNGKNLNSETLSIKLDDKIRVNETKIHEKEKFFEQAVIL